MTRGKSCPFAIICVPTSTSISPSSNRRRRLSWAPPLAHRIPIHARDARSRHDLGDLVFDPLRPFTQLAQLGASAGGTGFGKRLLAPASMTPQAPRLLVPGHGETALAAGQTPAAGGTQDRRRPSAAVAQDQRLLAARKARRKLLRRALRRAESTAPARAELLPHVDEANLGKRTVLDAAAQGEEVVASPSGVMERLERRRRRAQDDRNGGEPGSHDRDVAAVVTRRVLLLVGRIVLFVDDDQAEIGERSEDGGARTDRRTASSRPEPPPKRRAARAAATPSGASRPDPGIAPRCATRGAASGRSPERGRARRGPTRSRLRRRGGTPPSSPSLSPPRGETSRTREPRPPEGASPAPRIAPAWAKGRPTSSVARRADATAASHASSRADRGGAPPRSPRPTSKGSSPRRNGSAREDGRRATASRAAGRRRP